MIKTLKDYGIVISQFSVNARIYEYHKQIERENRRAKGYKTQRRLC